ncbi:zinc finger, AN1-type domain [Mortierella sp. NVP85]|nr:zinc finger, AN1-type domain [Mortierella sp. NVP85]
MELPSVGKHCSDSSCSQLDFLPYSCHQDHWKLDNHACPNKADADRLDLRVPTCPLCQRPVPTPKGEDPNIRMNDHISAGCPEPPTSVSKPINTNACNAKKCKNRFITPIICSSCHKNFCLSHRLENHHECTGKSQGPASSSSAKRPSATATTTTARKTAASSSSTAHGNNQSLLAKARAAAESRAAATQSRAPSRPATTAPGKKDKENCTIF